MCGVPHLDGGNGDVGRRGHVGVGVAGMVGSLSLPETPPEPVSVCLCVLVQGGSTSGGGTGQ